MSKRYTREQIIKERLCGLKYFDRAINKVGKKVVIDEVMKNFQEFPCISPDNAWERMSWANANAIMEIIDNCQPVSANLDEMYDENDMLYISTVAGIPLPDTSARKRKKS